MSSYLLNLKCRYSSIALLAIAMTAPWVSPAATQSSQSTDDALVQQPELAAAMAQYRRALEEYKIGRAHV